MVSLAGKLTFASPGAQRSDTTHNNMFIRWEKGADGRWRFSRVLLSPERAPAK